MCVYTQVKYYPSTDIIRINNLKVDMIDLI